mgnify:CR=1 FL=1
MPTTFFQRRTKQRETVIVIGIAGFLAACGGGGGVSSAAPELTNRAPVFDQASYALTSPFKKIRARQSVVFRFLIQTVTP